MENADRAWSVSHDPLVTPLLLNLHRARAEALARARVIWSARQLAPAEFDVLASLRNAPPPHVLTPSHLQAALLITSGGLSKVMGQLETRRLVCRPRQDRDQRVKPVRLTAAGRRLVEAVMAELAAATGGWVRERLDHGDILMLTELLARLVRREPAAPGPAADRPDGLTDS